MRKKIHRVFWAWEFDKEERWLNEMSAKGMQLVSVGFCTYIFQEGQPDEYGIRLELLGNSLNSDESREYIHFIEDTGAEYLGNVLNWVYFRKKLSEGEFEIYSDTKSKLMHLRRILKLLGFLGVLELVLGLYNIVLFFIGIGFVANLFAGSICVLLGCFIVAGFVRVRKITLSLEGTATLYE